MERKIELTLRIDGKEKTFTQNFVPFSKRVDYIRLERELEEEAEKNEKAVTEEEYTALQMDFVAGLFDDKAITRETIESGLDVLEIKKIWEIIRYRVLGYVKEDDELLKKEKAEEM